MSSGNKYHRVIHGLDKHHQIRTSVTVDVYSVLTAFNVTSPGLQHAIQKLLCAGIREKGTRLQDLKEARDALDRAIEDEERESEMNKAEQEKETKEYLRDIALNRFVRPVE